MLEEDEINDEAELPTAEELGIPAATQAAPVKIVRQSERMDRELRAIRDMFDEAVANKDSARATSLARIIEAYERNIEKARIREGLYITEEALAAHEQKFISRFLDIARRHVPDDEAWGRLVAEFLLDD